MPVVHHRHSNRDLLNSIGEANVHAHENKDLLDGIEEANVHAHENKDLLDSIGEANVHAHTNKTELDKVTDGDHDVRTDNPHSVTAAQLGAPVIHRAAADPAGTDTGIDWWFNTTDETLWFCVDPTAETAVWKQVALMETE